MSTFYDLQKRMKKIFGTILILWGVLALLVAILRMESAGDSSQLIANLTVPIIPIIFGLVLWQKKKEPSD